jgi:hypothetical protein
VHFFQPPLEITDEAVEAAAGHIAYSVEREPVLKVARLALEAALRVMQKGQDE